jgi:hypothetical protein
MPNKKVSSARRRQCHHSPEIVGMLGHPHARSKTGKITGTRASRNIRLQCCNIYITVNLTFLKEAEHRFSHKHNLELQLLTQHSCLTQSKNTGPLQVFCLQIQGHGSVNSINAQHVAWNTLVSPKQLM